MDAMIFPAEIVVFIFLAKGEKVLSLFFFILGH